MKTNTHLSDDEFAQHLIEPDSLSVVRQHHLQQCAMCQERSRLFFENIKMSEKCLGQRQDRARHSRRRLWDRIDPQSTSQIVSRLVVGATLALLLYVFFGPMTIPVTPVHSTWLEWAQMETEDETLLQFAATLTPECEYLEPDIFIINEGKDLETRNFNDFISYILLQQEQS